MKQAPCLGDCHGADTWNEAVDLAVKLALEQLGEEGDDGEIEVRAEIEADGDYYDPKSRHETFSLC
jgi:hypothetical protein